MFRALGEAELRLLDDDQLIAYLRLARRAGDPSVGLALWVLVGGHWDNVVRRVGMRVPAEAVEDVAGEVVVSAVQSSFDGSSVGEFHAWLARITQRRTADFYRRRTAQTVPLDDLPLLAPDDNAVDFADAIERTLKQFNPAHRYVIERWLAGVPAAEIEGFTAANVHKITSRFREALRQELDTG